MARLIRTGGRQDASSSLPWCPPAVLAPLGNTAAGQSHAFGRRITEPYPKKRRQQATFSNNLCQRLPDGLGDPLAAALARTVSFQHPQDLETDRTAADPHRPRSEDLPGAVDGHGDDRHVGAFGGRKGPSQKLADPVGPIEGALGKEYERLPGGGELPHPARIRSPLVTVEALDEGRAEPPEQQTRQRHADHLLLDDKGEFGRQGGRGDDSVNVARMVGDDNARSPRQALASLDLQPNTGAPQEPSR